MRSNAGKDIFNWNVRPQVVEFGLESNAGFLAWRSKKRAMTMAGGGNGQDSQSSQSVQGVVQDSSSSTSSQSLSENANVPVRKCPKNLNFVPKNLVFHKICPKRCVIVLKNIVFGSKIV